MYKPEILQQVPKGLKLKVRKFLGLIPTFIEITGEKLVGGTFLPPHPLPILNSVKSLDDSLSIIQ